MQVQIVPYPLESDVTEDELLAKVRDLTKIPTWTASSVQLPLPQAHLRTERIIEPSTIAKT